MATQHDVGELIDTVGRKNGNHSQALRDLDDPDKGGWLEDERPDDYETRKAHHTAWKEITDRVLSWLWGLKGDQETVSGAKLKRKKQEAIVAVMEEEGVCCEVCESEYESAKTGLQTA